VDKKIIIKKIVVGALQANCYLLGNARTKEAILIDPGAEPEKIKSVMKSSGLTLKKIILTHGHYDHIGALTEFNVPVYVHEDDMEFLKDNNLNLGYGPVFEERMGFEINALRDKDKINLADLQLEVIHTPGHTPGGIALKIDGILFSGDTLFYRGIGRTDLPRGSFAQIECSIKERLFKLSGDTKVFPGHGPATTIGQEKKENGFL